MDSARSGTHGFSLTQLAALADQAGLKHELVHREPGQPIPVPSIINWNVHHYAAIVSQHDGLYQLLDPTFGDGAMVVTANAIDTESSGYFLVPAEVAAAMPESGLQRISALSPEAKGVYGMGTVSNSVPPMPNDICILCKLYSYLFSQDDKPPQMTIANAQAMVVGLNLKDTPVGYVPQKGIPATTTVSYVQRDAAQPALFSFSNVSPKWTHSWQTYVQDDPNNPGNRVIRVASGGGGYDYSIVGGYPYGYNTTTGASPPETPENSQLFRVPPTGPATSYVRNMPDGSREVYAFSNGATTWPRLMFLTSVSDAAGNTTTLHYDAQFRITTVTDALGRNTTFSYGLPSAPLLITRITDPFGRFTQLTYDMAWRLKSITDPIGITSSYTYSELEPSFITSLTTPYGTSRFSDTPNPNDHPHSYPDTRSLTLTDPLGYTDYLYFYQSGSSSSPSERVVPSGMSNDNGILQWRNTYYWNKYAFTGNVTLNSSGVVISEDFTKSEIKHWLHYCCNLTYASRELGSDKKPLENRVWNNYPGMNPSGYYYYSGYLDLQDATGRVLDDGTTQLSQATYNTLGLPLSKIDPQGRTTTFAYASNNIDLQTIQQLTSSGYTTITTFGDYNSQHEPQLYTGADGQNWRYSYNPAGQLATVTDPNSGVTTYNYDSSGRLSTVVNANHQTVLTLSYDSDALDRIAKITYPDTTTDLYDYTFQGGPFQGTPSLDLRKHVDRLGRITTYGYDADRRLISVTEPISTSPGIVTRTTRYDYYEDGTLKDIIDANGNVTHWEIDLESRPISKTYAYGTPNAQTETYVYENTTSRLHSITDALGQTKTLTYRKDDRVTDIAYTNTVNPTPDVSFSWDGYFPRLSALADGLGTTNYSYTAIGTNGALKLASVDGPFSNDTIGLTYDALGRLGGRNIPGGNESFTYDAISRLTSHATPLGSFTYGYLGQTDQTTSRSVTNGTTTVSTGWGYDANRNDRRLISITNSGVTRSYALSYLINPSRALFNPYDITKITDNPPVGHPWAMQSHKVGIRFTQQAPTDCGLPFAFLRSG